MCASRLPHPLYANQPPPPRPRTTRRLPPPRQAKHFSPPPSPLEKQSRPIHALGKCLGHARVRAADALQEGTHAHCLTPLITYCAADGKSAASPRTATSVVSRVDQALSTSGLDRLNADTARRVANVDEIPGSDQHHDTEDRSNKDATPRVDQCLSTSGLLERSLTPRVYRQMSTSKLGRSRSSASKVDRTGGGLSTTRRQLGDRSTPSKFKGSPQKKLLHHHYHHMHKGGIPASELMAASIRDAEEAAARAAEALARTHHSMRQIGAGHSRDDETDTYSTRTASTRRSRSRYY